MVSLPRNSATLDDSNDSNNKDDEEEAAAAAEATDGIKHPAWFGKAEGHTGRRVEGSATTNWSGGSDFLAKERGGELRGGWLSAWGSCGRTSGFTGASHLTV